MQSLMGETPKTALHRFLIPHTPHPTPHTPHLTSLLKTYPCEGKPPAGRRCLPLTALPPLFPC
ncbi:MAG: hypothetical protein F6J98_12120 [Moorea sp. SIO4G2]|nr:hypothetical protein [Moorena sp. SIO4G2]